MQLYPEQLKEIQDLCKTKLTNTEIARRYGVHHSFISKVRSGKITRTHRAYDKELCQLLITKAETMTKAAICREYGTSPKTLNKILKGEY